MKECMKEYKYIILGAGIAGTSLAYFLSKSQAYEDVLLIDANTSIASEASGAAGAFLSPLLGKDNVFKNLVKNALEFSSKFYLKNMPELYFPCGVLRLPKDKQDENKFIDYEKYLDFTYKKIKNAYFFDVGALVFSSNICKALAKNTKTILGEKILNIEHKDDFWYLKGTSNFKTKNLILCTGHKLKELINEPYLDIRELWGQRIDISTSRKFEHNYHKKCSLSKTYFSKNFNQDIVSIGASHHRFTKNYGKNTFLEEQINLKKLCKNPVSYKQGLSKDLDILISRAREIAPLDDIKILDTFVGARACSIDYFPFVGEIISSKNSLEANKNIKNGLEVPKEKLKYYKNLFVFNGLGGRGFVLAPYLANILASTLTNNPLMQKNILDKHLKKHLDLDIRFFRYARKL